MVTLLWQRYYFKGGLSLHHFNINEITSEQRKSFLAPGQQMKEIEIKILNSEVFEYEKKYPSAIIKIRNISVCSILSWGKNTFFQIIVPWALHKLYDRIKQTPKKVRCCFSKWIAWRIFHYFVGHPYNCVVIALRHFAFCRFHQIFRSRSICCPQGIHASLIRVRMKRTSSRKQHFPPWSLSPIQLNPPPSLFLVLKNEHKQNRIAQRK